MSGPRLLSGVPKVNATEKPPLQMGLEYWVTFSPPIARPFLITDSPRMPSHLSVARWSEYKRGGINPWRQPGRRPAYKPPCPEVTLPSYLQSDPEPFVMQQRSVIGPNLNITRIRRARCLTHSFICIPDMGRSRGRGEEAGGRRKKIVLFITKVCC